MKPIIIFIFGPTGSGKSTIAKEICKLKDPCVRIDIDRIKHLIENGFVYDQSQNGVRQWKILLKNIKDLTSNFYKAGYNVIIDGMLPNNEIINLDNYIKQLSPRAKSFLLYIQNKKENLSRNIGRKELHQQEDECVMDHRKNFLDNWKYWSERFETFEAIKSAKKSAEMILELIRK